MDPAVRRATVDPVALPAVRPVTSTDPEVVLAARRPVTSTALAAMIGGRRSVLRTTTGAGDSTAPRGVTDCRHGAGARRRRPIWDGPLPEAWGPPPPPINYFGFNEQPVWDPGYNQWGFYFFGIWIPLPV